MTAFSLKAVTLIGLYAKGLSSRCHLGFVVSVDWMKLPSHAEAELTDKAQHLSFQMFGLQLLSLPNV